MPQRTLRFKIFQDGRVQESVEGFEGELCNDATKNLEDALGEVKIKRLTTDAFVNRQNKNITTLKNESNVSF
tara:strand:+ start:1666 stop:1881 length:216 start_codon:yes stop_codon:yes gene_type:complete